MTSVKSLSGGFSSYGLPTNLKPQSLKVDLAKQTVSNKLQHPLSPNASILFEGVNSNSTKTQSASPYVGLGLDLVQKPAPRFGSIALIPTEQDIKFLNACENGSPEFTQLFQTATIIQQKFHSPVLGLHHFALAAIDLAEKELNEKFQFAFPNRLDIIGSSPELPQLGRRFLNFFPAPPHINGFIPEKLYRELTAENAQIPVHGPDEEGNIVVKFEIPAKSYYIPGNLSQQNIRQLLKGLRLRLTNQVKQSLNTASPDDQTQMMNLLQKITIAAHQKAMITKSDKKLYPAQLIQSIVEAGEAEMAKAPPAFKELYTLLKDIQEEAQVIATQSNNESEGLVSTLDELSASGHMPQKVRLQIRQEIERLARKDGKDPETDMIKTWVDRAMSLPWAKTPPVEIDLKKARTILDRDHYGMEDVKKRVIDYLATLKQNPNAKPKYLCFVGPPGTGKTSISRDIAEALGKNFERISVDGISDEHEIKGHRKTYIGAMPGMITEAVKRSKSLNPVVLIDEVDKLGGSGDPKVQAAKSALLSALDPEQNKEFQDLYYGFPFPLNDVFFILTANYIEQIPPALRDRVEVIQLDRYDDMEKYEIAKRHVVPQVLKNQGLSGNEIEITPEAIHKTIEQYTREAGVRVLKQKLGRLAEVVTTLRQSSDNPSQYPKVTITPEMVESPDYLGNPLFEKPGRISGKATGEINGLGYTDFGGSTLTAQVNATPADSWRTGNITGNLQEVMQESAKYSLGYLKAHHDTLALKDKFKDAKGIEVDIHFPAAATPKDGPSAGAAITTCIVSEITGIPVRPEIAMTGEIDIKGNIRPIGGVKEKVDAAYRAGITEVFIPEQNKKDIPKIPEVQRQAVKIIPVSHINEILAKALQSNPFLPKSGDTAAS
jgi:endopeptidase La